ncbi:metallopeptidase TldD-related protein [Fusibacter sp. JL298sf-3]
MKKEFLTQTTQEMAIKVRNTRVEAIRNKNITKKGVRVYKDGLIGISGAIGDVDDAVLLKQAEDNLKTRLPYPYALSAGVKDHRSYCENTTTASELLNHTTEILETLRTEYPAFDFSETALHKTSRVQLTNSEGLDLAFETTTYELGFLLKDKKSANLFDGFLLNSGHRFDPDAFWAFNRELLDAYSNEVPLPDKEEMPVIHLAPGVAQIFLNRSLNGERYALGSSLFSGKIGEKLFDERVTVEQSRDPLLFNEPFFDTEGTVVENDAYPLIENGVLKNVYTDKKIAHKYDLPHTGAAGGGYDDLPTLAPQYLFIRPDSEDLKAALNGEPAVLVVISSGGDFTSDGDYAAPVQTSFLFDGEKIVGKLPEFSIRSNIFDMLGKDYIGTFKNRVFYMGDFENHLQVSRMTIVR